MQRPGLSLANSNLNGLPPDHPDLERDRRQNDHILQSAWEAIFEKYERDFTGVGDEIDLETGDIVVNNGHIFQMREEADVGGTQVAHLMRSFVGEREREEEDEEDEYADSESNGGDAERDTSRSSSVVFQNQSELQHLEGLYPRPNTGGSGQRRSSGNGTDRDPHALDSRQHQGDDTTTAVQLHQDQGQDHLTSGDNVPERSLDQNSARRQAQPPHQPPHQPPSHSAQTLPEAYNTALQDFSQSIASQITSFMGQWMVAFQSNGTVPPMPNIANSLGQAFPSLPNLPNPPSNHAPRNTWAYPSLPSRPSPPPKRKRGYDETLIRSPKRRSLWAPDSSDDDIDSSDDEHLRVLPNARQHGRNAQGTSARNRLSNVLEPPGPGGDDAANVLDRDGLDPDLAEPENQPDDEVEEGEDQIDQVDFSNVVSPFYVRPVWQRFKRRDGKLITILKEKYGKGWSDIMYYFPGRAEAHVQYFYYKYLHETKGRKKRPYTQPAIGRAAMMRYAREGRIPPIFAQARVEPKPNRGNPSLEELQALQERLRQAPPVIYTPEALKRYRGPYPPKFQELPSTKPTRMPETPNKLAQWHERPGDHDPDAQAQSVSEELPSESHNPVVPSSSPSQQQTCQAITEGHAISREASPVQMIELWSSSARHSDVQSMLDGNTLSELNSIFGSTPTKPVPKHHMETASGWKSHTTPLKERKSVSPPQSRPSTSHSDEPVLALWGPKNPISTPAKHPPSQQIATTSGQKSHASPVEDPKAVSPRNSRASSSHSDEPVLALWGQKNSTSTPAKPPAKELTNPLPSPADGASSKSQPTPSEIPNSTQETEIIDSTEPERQPTSPATAKQLEVEQATPTRSRGTRSNTEVINVSTVEGEVQKVLSRKSSPKQNEDRHSDATGAAPEVSNDVAATITPVKASNNTATAPTPAKATLSVSDQPTPTPSRHQPSDVGSIPSSPPKPIHSSPSKGLERYPSTLRQASVIRTPTRKIREESVSTRKSSTRQGTRLLSSGGSQKQRSIAKRSREIQEESEDELAL